MRGRMPTQAQRFSLRAAVLAATGALALPAAAAERYDIAYYWSPDLQHARSYREALAAVLGREIAPRLRLVRGEQAFGVIFDRDGDLASTAALAEAHARFLAARGLHGAASIPSRPWRAAELEQAGEAASAEHAPATRSGAPASIEEAPPSVVPPDAEPVHRAEPPAVAVAPAERPLDAAFRRELASLGTRGALASDERTAVAVFDLTAGESLAALGADVPLQAASMIKPFVALAFFHEVAAGRLQYGPRSRRRLTRMIQDSDNSATNWALRQLGGPSRLQSLLRRHYAHLLPDTEIVEYIPSGGRTYRNRASASDYIRFLRALWHEELPAAREIKRLMSLPNRDRLGGDERRRPETMRVYDKTGSTRQLCGNMGIVELAGRDGQRYAWAVAVVIEKGVGASSYGRWMRARSDAIRDLAALAESAMVARYPARLTASGARQATGAR